MSTLSIVRGDFEIFATTGTKWREAVTALAISIPPVSR